MTLTPQRATWFELVVPTDHYLEAIEVLADTGRVELATDSEDWGTKSAEHLQRPLQKFLQLKQHYAAYWPHADFRDTSPLRFEQIEKGIGQLDAWAQHSDRIINRLQTLQESWREARFWQRVINRLHQQDVSLDELSAKGAFYNVHACCRVDNKADGLLVDIPTINIPFTLDEKPCQIVINSSKDSFNATQIPGYQCHPLPEWLSNCHEHQSICLSRVSQLEQEIEKLEGQLTQLTHQYQLGHWLGQLARLQWLSEQFTRVQAGDYLCWIRGWFDGDDLSAIEQGFADKQIPAVVHTQGKPANELPPLILKNPAWVKPFEQFVRLMGIPGDHSVDPSIILSLAVPLIFGYMFGDVGHGLVIALLGVVLQKRYPIARLMIPCGISGILFGILFGSIFGLEHILPPLWLHPLDQPLLVLAIPMLFGVFLLVLGIILNSLQQRWQYSQYHALTELSFLLIYLGLLASFFDSASLWLTLVGFISYGFFTAMSANAGKRLSALLTHLGHLIETTLQILINTLSFVRIGAFAMAHAGLSSAVISLTSNSESIISYALIFILGNLLIIALEGLVVSIQTTRLVLFEFFIRFIQGEGRVFKPMPYPPTHRKGGINAIHH